MRSFAVLVVLAGCAAARPPPVKTAVPPASAIEQACVAACEAPVEAEVTYIAPDDDGSAITTGSDEATCRLVGHAMASLELGYHADVDALAPRIDAYEKECVRLRLDAVARACVTEQRDVASVAYCAPALAPPESAPPMFAATECDGLFAEIDRRSPATSAYAPARRGWDVRAPRYLASCKEGRWTTQFASCARASRPDHCHDSAITPLRTALDAILVREQQDRARRDAAFADPKKHPDVRIPRLAANECRALIRGTTKRVTARGPGDWQHAWWPPRASAFETSCIADRWPRDFGGCMSELDIHQCMDLAPSTLQAKLYAIYNATPR